MFNSTIIEVALGLVFCYASVALIVSSVFEAVSSWFNLRSKTLFKGVEQLLNADSEGGTNLLLKIYNDAMAHPAGNGQAQSIKEIKNKPDHIEPENFARALLHGIQQVSGSFDGLEDDIKAIPNPQLRNALHSLHHKAGGDLEKFQSEIANWFDSAMGRISTAYKKQSQIWCFIFALVFAVGFNIDSVHLFQVLWQHPVAIAELAVAQTDSVSAQQAMTQLQALPIGWQSSFTWESISVSAIFGWLLTATASLFGAPFWFDLLKRITQVASTVKAVNAAAKKD